MIRKIFVLILLAIALPASAQPRQLCAPRAALLEKLSQDFGEVPFARGIDGGGNLMEILTGPKGSWTLLIVRPDKIACIVGSGEGWLVYEPTVPGRGA
jgi:hypothetical protein